MIIFEDLDDTYSQIMHWHSLVTIPQIEYSVQLIKCSLTNECPNHNIVRHVISSWIELEFSLTVTWIAMTRTDGTNEPNLVGQAEKGQVSNLLNNTRL